MTKTIQRKQTRIHLSKSSLILSALLLALSLWSQPKIAQAQWSSSGNNVYTTDSGNDVGIGTGFPAYKLHIFGDLGVDAGRQIFARYSSDETYKAALSWNALQLGNNGVNYIIAGRTATNGSLIFVTNNTNDFKHGVMGHNGIETMALTASGNVGIGTTIPGEKLHLEGGNLFIPRSSVFGHKGGAYSYFRELNQGIGTLSIGAAISYNAVYDTGSDNRWESIAGGHANAIQVGEGPIAFFVSNPLAGSAVPISWTEAMRINTDGKVGIGITAPSTALHVVGDVTVTGNIAAKYQDVAEWVPSPKVMPAGTVVILDIAHSNQVLPSMRAYDTKVAGVISEMPGLLLGEAGEGKVKVATTGRVKVKVDATKKPVQVGDLLVTSDKEGVAMKSEALDLGGVPIHRPGTLIGKALEPLKEGEGEILVLLSLQ